jgi:predicted  nucleic acid-binding Zn-ribbon protein
MTSEDDEFAKLYRYMQGEFKEIKDRLDKTATQTSLDQLTSTVDAYAKRTETYMQEMLALTHKVERLEEWILKVAEATGVKLAS